MPSDLVARLRTSNSLTAKRSADRIEELEREVARLQTEVPQLIRNERERCAKIAEASAVHHHGVKVGTGIAKAIRSGKTIEAIKGNITPDAWDEICKHARGEP